MSTYIHQISQAEFAERNAKLNRTIEGMTVAVPNVFDRMLAALRNMRQASRRQHRQDRTAYGAVAK
jgi:hypothetical protein